VAVRLAILRAIFLRPIFWTVKTVMPVVTVAWAASFATVPAAGPYLQIASSAALFDHGPVLLTDRLTVLRAGLCSLIGAVNLASQAMRTVFEKKSSSRFPS
jgi:hypothetical protein